MDPAGEAEEGRTFHEEAPQVDMALEALQQRRALHATAGWEERCMERMDQAPEQNETQPLHVNLEPDIRNNVIMSRLQCMLHNHAAGLNVLPTLRAPYINLKLSQLTLHVNVGQ